HDQVEAMTLADRIAVLHQGVLQQLASPLDLYERPANRFVAGFIGSPAMSFAEGTAAGGKLEAFGASLPLPARLASFAGPCVAGIRPEHLSEPPLQRAVPITVAVELVEPLGSETFVSGIAAG